MPEIVTMLVKRIIALTREALSFDSGDYIAVDSEAAGSRKMSKDTLLKETAQNALAGNVAPAFDPTRDENHKYLAGERVTYNGKTYTFKVDHYGAWAAADVYEHNGIVPNTNFVAITTAYDVFSGYISETDGELQIYGSSSWKTYIFPVQPGEKYKANLFGTSSSNLAVAFLTYGLLRARYYLSGVFAKNSVGAFDYEFTVPDNCNYIAICNRYSSMAVPTLFCFRDEKKLADELFGKNFVKVVDDYAGGISYNGVVDIGYKPGYIVNPSGQFYSEGSYRSFYIKNKGYNRVEAHIGLIGTGSFAIAFFSGDTPSEKTLMSGVAPIATSDPQVCYGVVPDGCKSIVVTTRVQNNATPKIVLSISPTSSTRGTAGSEIIEYSRKKRNSVLQQRWSWSGTDSVDEGKHNTLMWFSDIHGDELAYQKMIKIKDWFFKDFIDDIVHSGDLYNDYYEAGKNFLGDDIINIVGNHDVWANGQHDLVSSPTVAYNALIKGRVDGWGVVQPSDAESQGKNYFYKDYAAASLRVIFLDSQNYDGYANFFDDNGVQDAWFTSVLADALANEKNVVVVSHYPPGAFTQSWQSNGFCTPNDSFFAYPFPGLTRVEDFITNGGKFVCWMCGHKHDDQFGLCGTKQIPVVQIASENTRRNENTARAFDSLSEHNFNFITFDTDKKLIKLTKYGCNMDSYMRARNSMCFDYENKVLISAN